MFIREELLKRGGGAEEIAKRIPLLRVVLLCSYAEGRATAASDVDPLVIYKGSKRDGAYSTCWDILSIPQLEFRVYAEEEYEELRASGSMLPKWLLELSQLNRWFQAARLKFLS